MTLRIAMISEHASPLAALGGVDSGGQNVYVAKVAENLAAEGCQVDVFTRRDSRELPEIVACGPRVRVIHVPAGPPMVVPKEELLPFMDQFAAGMIDFCHKQGRYDLVHANFFMSGVVGCEIKRRLGTPLVITFHALSRVRLQHQREADRFPRERPYIEERIMRRADRIVAQCPQDKADQMSLYAADPEKIRIVPCGVDLEELRPVDRNVARVEIGAPGDGLLIAQIGRIVPRKGIDDAIRGFAHLVRKVTTPARMVIVGGESDAADPIVTPEIGRLQHVACQCGVADRVMFTGRRSRAALKYYYSAADVFVTTPWYEPFGMTPLEAMACGTPVVGANVGGIKHSIVDGETGLLTPPRDPVQLGERLVTLCSDGALRRRMSQAALRRVHTHFTWRRVVSQLLRVFREAVTPKAPAPVRLANRLPFRSTLPST